MKKAGIIALTFILIASLMTACGCNGRTPTDPVTTGSTQTTAPATSTTKAPTTAPTTTASTAPTTTAGTAPTQDTNNGILPDPTDGTDEHGRLRRGHQMPLR